MTRYRDARAWANASERGHYGAMKLLYWLYRFGGRWLLYPPLALVVFYFYLTRPATRRHSRHYLRRVLGREPGRWRVWRHHWSFGVALLNRLGAWMNRIQRTDVRFPGHQLMLDLQAQKRGAVMLGAHFGNLEMCRAVVENDGSLRLNVILHKAGREKFNRLVRDVSDKAEVRLFQVSEVNPATAMLLKEKLDQGEFLIVLADRLPPVASARSLSAPFLGDEAAFPAGPFWLALMLGAPVYFMAGFTTEKGYEAVMEPLYNGEPVPRREREQVCDRLLKAYIERLEHYCRRYPYQWFNFFDFWGDDRSPHNNEQE